jgi:hypothetical protein
MAEQTLHDLIVRVTRLDGLPNGRFVLQGHSAAGGQNAQIYGPDGRCRRSFAMGRAVDCGGPLWSLL